ncbi:MAG TPA: hypothetical protein VJ302_37020 [Blastocatellia bacterium]|nr:hypothetical protein [Blastocatellia bacterium]
MLDDLIRNAAKLMGEQAAAYRRLDSACLQLAAALVNAQPETIDSLTRAGEGELLKMRARLVQLMTALASFADARSQGEKQTPLSAETRTLFREASRELLAAAQHFQRSRTRAAALANNGATFASVGIESCGVTPTTYRAPYARRGEGRPWA